MQVKVDRRENGIIKRFTVSGFPRHKSCFEMMGKSFELDLTLNGEYYKTPSGAYSMLPAIDDSKTIDGRQSMFYQVILTIQPAMAEFQVFRLDDVPAISEADLGRLNIQRKTFELVTTSYPKEIARLLDVDMLPDSVAKFLIQAKKCTSS